jgi:hypothetical protein
MEHITKQILALRSELTTDSQKDRLNKIQSWTQGEIDKLRSRIETLSKNVVDEIEVVDAISNVTRLTISSERTTLKIGIGIQSEKVRADLIEVAKLMKKEWVGPYTMRGSVGYEHDSYRVRLQGGGGSMSRNIKL